MGGRKIYFTPYNQDKVANPGSAWCGLVYIVFALVLFIPQFTFAADLVPVQTAPGTGRALPAQPAAPAPAAPGPRRPETVPPPTPSPPAPSTPPLRPGQMLFNFQDADIQAVVKTVSQISGRNFLLDPRVKGKITIISAKPVSANAAYQIFLSALKAQGFTAVEGPGGIVKILPEAEAKQNAVVSSASQPGGGDRLITQVVVVQHGSATQMVPLLRPLMAPSGLLSVYAPANTLVITDYADNVRRLLQIIEKIDQPGSAEVTIIPLEYASALDMAQLLVRLSDVALPQPGQPVAVGQIGGDGGRLSIVPDLRTNSLLVRTDNQGRVNQLRALVAKLDVPARRGGNTRVVYLRNAEAVKLAEILRGLLAGEARSQATPSGAVGGPVPVGAAARSATEASLIQPDEASNSLIISAPDAVYNNLRAVIEKLDIRRAQVFVEALIVEVSTDLAAQFGIQWAGAKGQGSGTLGGVQNFPLTGSGIINIATNPTSLANAAGLTIGYVGKKITLPGGQEIVGLGALARALEADTSANVLSTPNLLTLDNAEAKIVVAQNVPFLTGSFAQATGATPGAAVNPFQTIERKDVGLTLKIKPQISEGEGIKLQIFEEVSDVIGKVSDAQDIVTNKRSLETTVIVDNGQTVVLGGLIQDKMTESFQAVPILGSIPLLGELFKFRSRTKTKTNLMVFLRPIIVRSPQDSEGFTAERYEYIRGQQQSMQMDRMTVIPRYENPVLPPLVQPANDQPEVKGKEEDVPGPQGSDKTRDTTKP